jgi:transposase
MYVRKTKTRNSICFQIGQKKAGKFVLVKHIGCASKPEEIESLKLKAQAELPNFQLVHQLSLFPSPNAVKAKLKSWRVTGFHRFFGPLYQAIGFPNNLLKDLTIARIVYPQSKLATVRYLNQRLGFSLTKDTVYRFLDTLDKDTLTKIAFDFVSKNNQDMNLVFYDVTTLYFETDKVDDFRQKGYSKDHRPDLPQIVVGLLIDRDGYPFDFEVFEGKVFEGHTLRSVVEKILERYLLTNLTIVADAGMLSDLNLDFLAAKGLSYIVGARLKNLPKSTTKNIFAQDFTKQAIYEINLSNKNSANQEKRLLVDFSAKRAKKDRANRERLVEKLRQKLDQKKTLVRKSKYLVWEDSGNIAGIDEVKITDDQKYDGLKGYLTNLNNKLTNQEIIEQYHNLWQVEKAFRMSKTDLAERPIFHRLKKRIKSHLLLCFCSLLVMKEAEQKLTVKNLSLAQAVEILEVVGEGEVTLGKITLPIEAEIDQTIKEILSLVEGH